MKTEVAAPDSAKWASAYAIIDANWGAIDSPKKNVTIHSPKPPPLTATNTTDDVSARAIDPTNIQPALSTVMVTVLLSVFLHGLSSVPFVAAYSRWYAAQDLAASTMQNYRRHIEEHLLPTFGELTVEEISALHIGEWEKAERAIGYAESSLKTWRATLHLVRAAKAWADQGWPAEPDESGTGITAPFNAPAQGPPPWDVYRVDARSATVALGVEPGGLTRFRF